MAESGKKRKRASNGIDIANKKTAHGVHADEHVTAPVIALSQGISAPSVTFTAYANTKSTILHSSEHPRLDFTAVPREDDLAHYIVVVEASDNIKIIPARHNQLQCVPRTEVAQNTPRKSRASQRSALGQEFGTKKAKKAIASRVINAITLAPAGTKDDVQAAILEEVAEQTGKEETIDLAAQLAGKPIPQPALDATTVEEVYPLSTLIPPSDMRLLLVKDWQEKAKAEENIQTYHRFTAYRVGRIGKTNDIQRLKALRYIGLLLQFNDALIKAGRAGKKVPKKEVLMEKLSDFPEPLVDGVRRKFSDEKNELGKWHSENLHTHICALSLYIDDWSTDTSNVRDDLKLDNKVITQYFSELGCKVGNMTEKERTERKYNKAQASTLRMARLNMPPEFPKPRTVRRK